MSFPDATFDVIVSNLCLHNIYDRATRLTGALPDRPRPQARRRRSHLRLQAHRRVCRGVPQGRPPGREKARQPAHHFSAAHRRHCPQTCVVAISGLRAASNIDWHKGGKRPIERNEEPQQRSKDAKDEQTPLVRQLHRSAERWPGPRHLRRSNQRLPRRPARQSPRRPALLRVAASGAHAHHPARHPRLLRAAHRRLPAPSSGPMATGQNRHSHPRPTPGMSPSPRSAATARSSRRSSKNPPADLYKPFRWGDGQNLLREALLIADHNAYHLGELIVLRRLLGAWHK